MNTNIYHKKFFNLFKLAVYELALFITISAPCYADKINFYIVGGPASTKLKNVNSVTINEFVTNDYQTDQHTSLNGMWGLGVAKTFAHVFNKPIDVSLGITHYTINLGAVEGTQYPFTNDSVFDTLNYKFYAKTNALMLESKLFYDLRNWKFFGLVGVGNAWNYLYNYSETPANPDLSSAPVPQLFSDHTQNSFAYELGVGIQRQLFEDRKDKVRYSASIDYRYFRLGKAELGNFPAQTSNEHLQINNMYTQSILFSFITSFI